MKKGDILEWKYVNGVCRGIVTESENGQLIIRVDDKTAFLLLCRGHKSIPCAKYVLQCYS